MLLRRITEHVKAQNWTAVALDFVIVVVGVFVGLQVSNWNDGRRVEDLEQSYLDRLANDLRDNIAIFESETEFATASRDKLKGFLEALKDPTISDAALIRHTNNYITDGAFFSTFNPTVSTFEDLQATGNLDIIRDDNLREALVELHANYAISSESFQINLDWALSADSRTYIQIDLLRFDRRTSAYFPEQNTADTAQYIRAHQDILTRHAAIHYWFKDRGVEIIRGATDQTKDVLNQIEGAG